MAATNRLRKRIRRRSRTDRKRPASRGPFHENVTCHWFYIGSIIPSMNRTTLITTIEERGCTIRSLRVRYIAILPAFWGDDQ